MSHKEAVLAPMRSRRSASKRNVREFHDMLRDELEIRARKNPQYSLRAFARDLEVAPSRLSEIIRGRRGLSVRTVAKISEKLNLSAKEKTYYTIRVQMVQAKDPRKKKKLALELKELETQFRIHETPVQTDIPLTWLHHGVLEASDLPDFRFNAQWVAERFGIEEKRAAQILNDLSRLSLLKVEGEKVVRLARWIKFVTAPGVDGVEARREDYSQLLDHAKRTVLEARVGTFLSTTQYMALPESCLEDVRAMIQEFKNKIVNYYDSAAPGERLYCMNVNFIPLDKKS